MPFTKGHKQFNSGKTHFKSGEHVSVSTEFKKGMIPWNWRGENMDKKAKHAWIKRRFPKPDSCEFCGKVTRLELSNKSQQYKLNLADWQWICAKCHRNYDDNANKAWITRRKNGTDKFYGNQYTGRLNQ